MTVFTINITDPAYLAGISAARAAANSSLTLERDERGDVKAIETHPGYLATDASYLQHVMESAAASYAKTYDVSDEAIAAMETKLAAMKSARGL